MIKRLERLVICNLQLNRKPTDKRADRAVNSGSYVSVVNVTDKEEVVHVVRMCSEQPKHRT
jgi:hypothetical protein